MRFLFGRDSFRFVKSIQEIHPADNPLSVEKDHFRMKDVISVQKKFTFTHMIIHSHIYLRNDVLLRSRYPRIRVIVQLIDISFISLHSRTKDN